MDIRMPVLGGVEATRRIAADDKLVPVHVLILREVWRRPTNRTSFATHRSGAGIMLALEGELVVEDELQPGLG